MMTETQRQFVEPEMFEPIMRPGSEGFVPLSAAIHWIMTACGTVQIALDDLAGWNDACKRLFSFIESGAIELAGQPRDGLAKQISGYAVASIKVLPPLNAPLADIFVHSPSHIKASIYLGKDMWREHFNDRLYLTGQASPAWTHLQVRKIDTLQRWPRPTPKISSQYGCQKWLIEQMEKSPTVRPKAKDRFWEEAKKKFGLPKRQFLRAWDKAIAQTGAIAWAKAGRPPGKSNHRTE